MPILVSSAFERQATMMLLGAAISHTSVNPSAALLTNCKTCLTALCKKTFVDLQIFFIAHKKFQHVSFLHVFHHTLMAYTWWWGVRFSPGKWTYNACKQPRMRHSFIATPDSGQPFCLLCCIFFASHLMETCDKRTPRINERPSINKIKRYVYFLRRVTIGQRRHLRLPVPEATRDTATAVVNAALLEKSAAAPRANLFLVLTY